jgi:hypothetical protein
MSAFNADEGLARASNAANELRSSDTGDVLERLSPEGIIELEQRRIRAAEDDAAALEAAVEDYDEMTLAIFDGEEFHADDIQECLTAAHVSPEEFAADLEKLNAEAALSAISHVRSRAKYAAAIRDRDAKYDRRSPMLDLFKEALTGICD